MIHPVSWATKLVYNERVQEGDRESERLKMFDLRIKKNIRDWILILQLRILWHRKFEFWELEVKTIEKNMNFEAEWEVKK